MRAGTSVVLISMNREMTVKQSSAARERKGGNEGERKSPVAMLTLIIGYVTVQVLKDRSGEFNGHVFKDFLE